MKVQTGRAVMMEQNHHTCQSLADGFFSLPLSLVFFLHPVFPHSPLRGGYSCPVSPPTMDRRNFFRSPDRMSWCHPCGDREWGWTDGLERAQTGRPVAAPLCSPDKRGQATSEPGSFKKHLKGFYHPAIESPWSPKTGPVAACILLYNWGKTRPLNHNTQRAVIHSTRFLDLFIWANDWCSDTSNGSQSNPANTGVCFLCDTDQIAKDF